MILACRTCRKASRFPISIVLVTCCFAGEEAPFSAVLHSDIVVAISTVGRLLAIVVLEQLLVVGFKCDGKQDTRVMLHETSLVVYNV